MDVPEVLEVQVVPSDEVRMVPLSPTTTNNPLDVVELSSLLFLAQEMAVRLKRKRERIVSICLIRFLS